MSRLFIRQPNRASNSAIDMAFHLGCRMIRRTNSRYRYRHGDKIVNWGNPVPVPGVPVYAYLNYPLAVANAIDKLTTWKYLQSWDVPTVEWTDDWQTAWEWMRDDGARLLVRTSLQGSQGRGIRAYSMDGTKWTASAHEFHEVGHGKAYVKVFGPVPRDVTEYRAHVVRGEVVDFAQKKRRRGVPSHPYIRSYDNGWVFCREDVALPYEARQAAVAAVQALGLDFGAVDLAAHSDGRVCVYEVNTAPGVEGTTQQTYADHIGELL